MCFTIVSFFSSNPKTVAKLFSVHQNELITLSKRALDQEGGFDQYSLSVDFPTQCTTIEILYRLHLIARATNNTTLQSLIHDNCPVDVSTLKQTDFISQARHMLNEYNKKTANAVQSIPIHSLFVVSTKTETSLGTVHWYLAFRVMNCRLDLGKETMSCYIEITDDSQQSSDLQLLSIRYSFLPYMTHSWSSLTSLDLIDRVFSLRIVYTLSSSSENDFLLPFLPSNENSLCIRIAFSNQDEFNI